MTTRTSCLPDYKKNSCDELTFWFLFGLKFEDTESVDRARVWLSTWEHTLEVERTLNIVIASKNCKLV